MSDPRTPDQPETPNDLQPAADPQPTEAYPPPAADAQPTEAYPAPAPDAQPTVAYSDAPPAYVGAAQPPVSPGAGQRPPFAPADLGTPDGKDSRPRTLAIIALVAGALGFLVSFGGFIPVAGIVFGVIASILLLVAFVLALVALISKKQGGKGFGIAALIVSVIGGILAAVAMSVGLLFTLGLAVSNAATSDLSSIEPSYPSDDASYPSDEPSDDVSAPSDEASLTANQQAYLDAVRPEIIALMKEAQPGVTDDEVTMIFSDETLLSLGDTFASLGQSGATEAARDSFVSSMVESSGGALNEEQAGRFFDTIDSAARQYLG